MGRIYKNQTKIKFEAHVDVDITGYLDAWIKYMKPTGSGGSWVATMEQNNPGIIYYYPVSAQILDVSGVWILWAYIKFADGREAAGEPQEVYIYEEGTEDL